jgi:hypothetical protein
MAGLFLVLYLADPSFTSLDASILRAVSSLEKLSVCSYFVYTDLFLSLIATSTTSFLFDCLCSVYTSSFAWTFFTLDDVRKQHPIRDHPRGKAPWKCANPPEQTPDRIRATAPRVMPSLPRSGREHCSRDTFPGIVGLDVDRIDSVGLATQRAGDLNEVLGTQFR